MLYFHSNGDSSLPFSSLSPKMQAFPLTLQTPAASSFFRRVSGGGKFDRCRNLWAEVGEHFLSFYPSFLWFLGDFERVIRFNEFIHKFKWSWGLCFINLVFLFPLLLFKRTLMCVCLLVLCFVHSEFIFHSKELMISFGVECIQGVCEKV